MNKKEEKCRPYHCKKKKKKLNLQKNENRKMKTEPYNINILQALHKCKTRGKTAHVTSRVITRKLYSINVQLSRIVPGGKTSQISD